MSLKDKVVINRIPGNILFWNTKILLHTDT